MRRLLSMLLAVIATLAPSVAASAVSMQAPGRAIVEARASATVGSSFEGGDALGLRVFLQRDPNGYQDSVNQYAYGANDPINHRDPTGRAVPAALALVAVPVMEYAVAISAGVCFGFGVLDEANGVDLCPGPADEAGRATRVLGRSGAKLGGELVEAAGTKAAEIGEAALKGGASLLEESRTVRGALVDTLRMRLAQLRSAAGRAAGARGREFEERLAARYGARKAFQEGGRDFDGAIGTRWYEAKSGSALAEIAGDAKKLERFKSDMGSRKRIAEQAEATYELHAEGEIPGSIKEYLREKGIPFFENLGF